MVRQREIEEHGGAILLHDHVVGFQVEMHRVLGVDRVIVLAGVTIVFGENYPDAAARDYVGVLYARFMFPDPAWAQAPQKVTTPGTERAVMGPYFPRSRYTTTARFERRGCRRGAHGASARG